MDEDKAFELTGSRVLAKAAVDDFDYVIRLADGAAIRFDGLDLSECGRWASLRGARTDTGAKDEAKRWERPLDIAVAHIIVAIDAPYGS